MSELDPEEEAVLETARRALTPPELVTRRMRAALVLKLAAPGVIAASSAAASGAAAASSAAVSSTAVVSGSAVATSAALSGSAAPLAAVVGSALASGAKVAASAVFLKAALGVTTAAVLATATSPYWLPATTGTAPSRPAATPTHVAPARVAPAPARPLEERPLSAQPAATTTAPISRREQAPAPQRSAAEAGPSREAPGAKLQGELDGLRHAQQAIQRGQPGRALELLSKLDAEYPGGSLWQEREVARVLALCGVGRAAAAREIAQRVLAVSPDSLYSSRIQASCAGPSTQPKAPATTSVENGGKSTTSTPPVARFGDSGN